MNRILVLNLVPNTIGDSILLTPMFSIIKKNHPDCFLAATSDLLANELWLKNRELDEILVLKELSIIGERKARKIIKAFYYLKMFFRLISLLRKRRFNLCFIVYPNFFVMPLIPFLAGIHERVGFTYKGSFFSFLLTKRTKSKILFDGYFERHIVESYMDLLKAADFAFSEKDIVSRIYVQPQEVAAIKRKLNLRGRLISIHAMSKLEAKNWPKSKFKELVRILPRKFKSKILLLGSKNEFNYNEDIRHNSKEVINLCGRISLRETAAVIKASELFIGNDSGLGHLASSVGTNTIILFGWSLPSQSKPIGWSKKVIIFKNKNMKKILNKDNYNAMKAISVKEVISKTEEMLSYLET